MSYAHKPLKIKMDWLTIALLSLFASFQLISLYVLDWFIALDFQQPEQSASVELGAGFIALVVVEVAVLLILWRLYKRLSGKWQRWVKYALYGTVSITLYYYGFYLYYLNGLAWLYVTIVPILWFTIKKVNTSEFKWIGYNLMAFGLGVYAVVALGIQLAPMLVVGIMAVFAVFDYFAVDLSSLMGEIVEFSASVGIPNYIVIPNQLKVDYDGLRTALASDGDTPESVTSIIGLGDFVFPTLLLTSVYTSVETVSLQVVGIVVGTLIATVVLRAAVDDRDGGAPALLWLNTGAIGGYGIAIVLAQISVIA